MDTDETNGWYKIMKKNILLILILTFILTVSTVSLADDTNTQTNTSGSNTNITGGYESTSTTTNNNDGQTNTTTSTTTNATTTNGSDIPPPSANAPSYSSMSQDVCSMGVSGSVTTGVVGISAGKHYVDLNCERIKLAKVLQDFGMKVASVAILCQDARVFSAMEAAGTPCPWQGKIGAEAAAMWENYPEMRPDYEMYLAKADIKDKKDAKIAKEIAEAEAKAQAEADRLAKEEAKKAEEEAKKREETLKKIEEAKKREEITIHIER